jgi:hypothetical protein
MRSSGGLLPAKHASAETQLPAAAPTGRAKPEGLRRHRTEVAGRALAGRAGRPGVQHQRNQPAQHHDDHDHQQYGVPGAAVGSEQHNIHDDHPPTSKQGIRTPRTPFAAVPAPPTELTISSECHRYAPPNSPTALCRTPRSTASLCGPSPRWITRRSRAEERDQRYVRSTFVSCEYRGEQAEIDSGVNMPAFAERWRISPAPSRSCRMRPAPMPPSSRCGLSC